MKYLITVNIPDTANVESASCIQQILDALKVLPLDYEASVDQILVEPNEPPADPPVEP